MAQEVVAFGIHSLTSSQADTLLAYHARLILAYLESPPSMPIMSSAKDQETQKEFIREEIRINMRQMNSIAAIHYRDGE